MENTMNIDEVDVLMVEDSPNDAELIVRALSKLNIANKIYWVRDGEEAVDFISIRKNIRRATRISRSRSCCST